MNLGEIALADHNGDGILDLDGVVESQAGNAALVTRWGLGNGTFDSPVTLQIALPFRQMVPGDFNGDSRIDLAGMTTNGVCVLLSLGPLGFKPPGACVPPGKGTMAVADVDADGNDDVAAGEAGPAVHVLLSRGQGTLIAGPTTTTLGAYPTPAFASVFGSKLVDLITMSSLELEAFPSLGNGGFSNSTASGIDGAGPIVIADFDRDGIPDVAMNRNKVAGVLVARGLGGGRFKEAMSWDVATGSRLLYGDFNNDGLPDILAVRSAVEFQVFLNTSK
jgi:hypothetical protein